MKYLQDVSLARLTARLQECRMGQRVIQGRIEAYTMKRTGSDKKYAADLGSKYVQQQNCFENEWNELVAAAAAGHVTDDDDSQKLTILKRGRSQSVGVCQDLMEQQSNSRRAKHPRSSSFDDLPLSGLQQQKFEHQQQPTPLGDLRELSTRRLMTDLILTLNMSFPDYDFSTAAPSDFRTVSLQDAMLDVYSQLSPFLCQANHGNEADLLTNAPISSSISVDGKHGRSSPPLSSGESLLLADLWNALDTLMNLKECDIYLWNSADMATDELWLWSFHYFFVNKHLKRVVFFTCSEKMQDRLPRDDGEDEDDDEEVEQAVTGRLLSDDTMESAEINFDKRMPRSAAKCSSRP
jgi:hypothetical protein